MARLAIVCGLAAEAKIADSPEHAVIAAGGDAARLERALDQSLKAAAGDLRGVISFGVAGGLAPELVPGDVAVADAVRAEASGDLYPTDAAWSDRIAARLKEGGIAAGRVTLVGVAAPVADVAAKTTLHTTTGASYVDMESHVAAAWATRHHVPFAVLRVITDPAGRSLPHAATIGMRADGSIDLPAILGSLMRDPRQLPALIRTGLDARAAFAALLRCRECLGPSFAFLDL